ncbi:hypothetical protein OSB04_024734 [Centaurea solstitialis]|uniref:Uncharacterized protein n=1 Tax=Centaurea solstitialis TaxID=347529 RepID=A0AA38W3D4_9ASTR|nr:hypothetical protein OSB04_024734 [Centaurea solstitialis]
MSLSDNVFHSICHLRTSREIWNTLCVQYDGTSVLMESRKIFLVHQYENFITIKGETFSQSHHRFNCLLIDLKTIGTVYSNYKVVTKFMEPLHKYRETNTTCLTMSKDIRHSLLVSCTTLENTNDPLSIFCKILSIAERLQRFFIADSLDNQRLLITDSVQYQQELTSAKYPLKGK